MIFTSALEETFRRRERENGININEECLNSLRFADDIIMFAVAETGEVNHLNTEGKREGNKMSNRKTKIVCNEVARRQERRNGIPINLW